MGHIHSEGYLFHIDGVANLFLNCRALLFLNCVLHSVTNLRRGKMRRKWRAGNDLLINCRTLLLVHCIALLLVNCVADLDQFVSYVVLVFSFFFLQNFKHIIVTCSFTVS